MRRRLLAVLLSLAAAFGAVTATACYGDGDDTQQDDVGGDGGAGY